MKQKVFSVLRLLFAPLKLLLLVGAVVTLMVVVNYTVDRSGLYQGDLTNRTIVELLLDGQAVSHYSQMDERAVLELYAAQVSEEQAPRILALGSSRVMQVTRNVVGQTSFYNCGMTGADYRDVYNAYYSFVKNGHTPETVILNIDPWLLRGDADALDRRSDPELFAEFLAVALGQDSGYVPPQQSTAYRVVDHVLTRTTKGLYTLSGLNISSETLPALFEPAYFQGNVAYYQQTRASGVATTDSGEDIPYAAVSAEQLRTNTEEIKLSDGSVWYTQEFRESDTATVLNNALAQAGTFLRMGGFTQLDADQCALFQQVVAYMQSQGTTVYFMLSPYHPFVYEYVSLNDVEDHAGFFAVEPFIRQYAADCGITVIGSYDPDRLGLGEEDFFDGLHVKESGIEKFFGGITADGQVLPGTQVDSTLLAIDPANDPDQGLSEDAGAETAA